MARIPLAWLQLTNEKLRLFAALAGISFAVILMLMQLGLQDALLDAAVLQYNLFDADLVLFSPQYEYIAAPKSFRRTRLYQTLAVEGVASVVPVYTTLAAWKNPVNHEETLLLLIGFDPRTNIFKAPGVPENAQFLEMPDVVLFDTRSHPEKFGVVETLFNRDKTVISEINGRRVRVAGLFQVGLGFASLGNVATSEQNFLRIMPQRDQEMIDLGMIRLKPGVSADRVQAELAAFLPKDVRVMTRKALMESEKVFWTKISPVGFVFGLGAVMGFVVGSVIVYQILSTDVSDHLSEYATLKAIGYSDAYLFSVVFKEALLLSVLGYIPGLAASYGLYVITVRATGLPIIMTVERAVLVLVFTVTMCAISGALAMRRIRSADPADIF
jgi:heterocyst specific transport system permease protein